ncbi:VQ [Macleaya cordata]|uniref:VQ n=1 Tax=Macleaya cordata TaxID=56857 RepID=A0A200QWP7_MACCD|nr:VQ [Macleaya cordata]
METSTNLQDKQNPFLQTSPNSNSSSINNGVQIIQPPSTPKPIFTSETNPYPTTFIQADTSSFKQVVQILTGSSETVKHASRSTTSTVDPLSKSVIPPIKTGPKKQGFKLYERRNSLKNIKLSPLIPGSVPNRNCGFSPRNNNNPEILSPSMLNFPSLVLSPVTPLIQDLFNKSSSSTSASSNSNSPVVEEEREITEKGFYLHPSPISTPRDSEPRLLPLFPLTSPRITGPSSSSSASSSS